MAALFHCDNDVAAKTQNRITQPRPLSVTLV